MQFRAASRALNLERRAPVAASRAARQATRDSAFTLVEVLAAMLFMAIVIPVAVEALHVASMSGEVATRKAEAVRVADNVLTQSVVTTNWNQAGLSGDVTEGGRQFRWTLNSQLWPQDSTMELLTAQVTFATGGREFSVRLSTLATPQTLGASMMSAQ